jgi:hypothetical protein
MFIFRRTSVAVADTLAIIAVFLIRSCCSRELGTSP